MEKNKEEKILGKYHCIHLTTHDLIEDMGYITLTNYKMHFLPFNKFVEPFEITVSSIECIEKSKLFNFIPTAVKITTIDGRSYKFKVSRKKEFVGNIMSLPMYKGLKSFKIV